MTANYYYELSLKTRQKPPKQVRFKYRGEMLQISTILNQILKTVRTVKSEKRKWDNVSMLKLLDRIIPADYFGANKNRKLFNAVVEKILTQNCHECIFKQCLYRDFHLDSIGWLQEMPQAKQAQLLCRINVFLLEKVVKPLVAFYYKAVKSFPGNEMKFVRREAWLSYESKIFTQLLSANYLIPADSGCKPRGIFKIIPKGDLSETNYRPLVSIYRDLDRKEIYKKITAKVYHAARNMNEFNSGTSLFQCWKNYREKIGDSTLYAVKLDVKDAFGSVDLNLLSNLISNLSEDLLDSTLKAFVLDHVTRQYVKFRGKIYQSRRLLQGDRLSSCLCELYMTYLDRMFLGKFKNPENFLHRTVDDYFFCTPHEHQIHDFIATVQSVHKINPDKTKSDSAAIPYCGKLFNVQNGQVGTVYAFEKRYEIRSKFKLWNVKRQISPDNVREFFRRAMHFPYNNNNFDSMLINTIFNNEQTVLGNYFDSMLCLAYKFDCAVTAVKSNPLENVESVVENTVREYASRIFQKLKLLKGNFDKGNITYKLLETVGFRAFVLVFKKRNECYKAIIAHIETNHKMSVFAGDGVDFKYFTRIPVKFSHVKLNRKCVL